MSYISGLIETDGDFYINLSKQGNFLCEVRISQKDINFLNECQNFLNIFKVYSTIYKQKTKLSSRASQLRIRAPKQVLNLCNLLQRYCKITFCSQKLRDLFIIKTCLKNNKSLNLAEKIDLIMSMHKINANQNDILKYSKKVLRKDHEKRLGLKKDQSKNAALKLLQKIDLDYENHKKYINNSFISNSKIFDDMWFVGLLDGDGYFGLRIRYYKNSINFYPVFSIPMENEAELTIDTFQFKFNKIGTKRAKKNVIELVISGNILNKVLNFYNINQPINKIKKAQLTLINEYLNFKQNHQLNNINITYYLIRKCYEVNKLGKGKNKLKYSLE